MKKTTENNPFRNALAIEVRELLVKAPARTYFTEVQASTAIYIDDSSLKIVRELPSASKDMLFYMMRYLGVNKETIKLNTEVYCERMGVTEKTFRTARQGLVNIVLIKKKDRKDIYFINPAFLFKGRRIDAFPTSRVIVYADPNIALARKMGFLPERNDVDSTLDLFDDE